MKKTSEQLRDEYGLVINISTIMRWRDRDDWEAKYLLVENQVKKLLRSSEDPILREMAMDDSLVMRFMGILTRLIEDCLGPKRNRMKFMPRNSNELMKMIDFITSQQTRILGNQQPQQEQQPSRIVYNDNRRIVLRDKLAAIPREQRRLMIDQIRGAAMTQKELHPVREQAWNADEDAS
jgi:hypothetical protein